MAKSVTAVKNILKAEEKMLERLEKTLHLMAHRESKASLREVIRGKKRDIRTYKSILKQAAKCPAVIGKKAPARKGCATRKPSRRSGCR